MEKGNVDEGERIELSIVSSSELVQAPPSNTNGLAKGALISGIIAMGFNLLGLTAILGFFIGIIAIVFGAMTFRESSFGKAGFIMGLLSMLIIVFYILSVVLVITADPFF
jgi:hypothetical protein